VARFSHSPSRAQDFQSWTVRGQSARHWFPRATRRYLSLHFHNQTVRP